MCMPEVEEQTEHYLSIEHGDSADRGMLTGALGGMGGGFCGAFALLFVFDISIEVQDLDTVSKVLTRLRQLKGVTDAKRKQS